MKTEKQKSKKGIGVSVRLRGKYSNIYFTYRETECVVWLLRGKKISDIATILNISLRTVEYYLENVKAKVGCRTKFELIDLIRASNFLKKAGIRE